MFPSNKGIQYEGCKCIISVEINSNVSKMIQANSLLFNFQMKSPCYLVTLSLESSDFQTFLKQYVILVPSALWFYNSSDTFLSGCVLLTENWWLGTVHQLHQIDQLRFRRNLMIKMFSYCGIHSQNFANELLQSCTARNVWSDPGIWRVLIRSGKLTTR